MRMLRGFASVTLLCCLDARAESLVELWQRVQQDEPRLGIVAARAQIADARLQGSRAELLPQVVAQGSLSKVDSVRTQPPLFGSPHSRFDGERFGVTLQQPLIDLGRWRNHQASQALVEQSGYETDRVVAELRMELLQRYLEAVAAEEGLQLARQEEATATGQAAQLKALQARQLATLTDALLAEARADMLRARTVRAQAELEVARGALATLAGGDAVRTRGLDAAQPLPPVDGPESQWQRQASEQSADLKALQAAEERARLEFERERARRLPVLSLQGAYQDSNVDYDNALSPRTRTASVGISVSVPLFTSGTLSAAVGEARAEHRIAGLELTGAERALSLQVREAYQLASGLRAQAAAAATAVQSAERTLEATTRANQLGAATLADVLDARRDLFAVRRDLVQVKLGYLMQWAALLRAGNALDDRAFATIDAVIRVE